MWIRFQILSCIVALCHSFQINHAGFAHCQYMTTRYRINCNAFQLHTLQMSASPSNSWLNILCPLLKLIGNTDPTEKRNFALETATSGIASLSRLPWGSEVSPVAAVRTSSPSKPIRLYEFEACPFCRRVRETITFLDLEVEVIPCPKGSILHRSEVAFPPARALLTLLKIRQNIRCWRWEERRCFRFWLTRTLEGNYTNPQIS